MLVRADGGDHAKKWTEFSIAIVAVLGASVLAVLAVVGVVSAVQMGGMMRGEQQRKAFNLADFMARRAFVAVSLEDTRTLRQLVAASLDDPDVVAIEITGPMGKPLVTRRRQKEPANRTVAVSLPIRSSSEAGGATNAAMIGQVKVTLSLSRVNAAVARYFRWIAIAGLAVLAAAVAVDLALIFLMTRRLRGLVGEANLSEALRRSNNELEQFAFVASHDLQEPLRKIISYCQLLENLYKGKLDAQAGEFINIIVSGSKRMSALIEDLLSFSRVGTQGSPLEPVDAGRVLGEVLIMMKGTIETEGADVVSEPLPMIMADPAQLAQLLQNLIGNALKFRGENTAEVRVTALREGVWWRFCVRDNGIGVESKHHERIFEMFKRLHTRDQYPGTGIGLAICKKIVERHGGRIWVESRLGHGAEFYFTLPAIASPGDG